MTAFRSRQASKQAELIEEARAEWERLWGADVAEQIYKDFQMLQEEYALPVRHALYGAKSWYRTTELIREEFGDRAVAELHLLARGLPGVPHISLRSLYYNALERG